MREWQDAVAAVQRLNPSTTHRVAAISVYDIRGPPRAMSLEEEAVMVGIIQAVAKWNGHDSSILLATGGNGVKEITDMQLGHQLWLCGSEVDGKRRPPMAPEMLLSELPVCPLPSALCRCETSHAEGDGRYACSQAAVSADSPTLYSRACGVFALLSI